MHNVAPDDPEVVFPPERFFYSRTDKRGVIQSGNALFASVSGYDPDALLGAPHRIVRHPDMPRCIFARLWAEIGADRPFSGYVVNRTQEGRHYWVFATLVSTPEGYISIRQAPRAAEFATAKALYATLKAAEGPRPAPDAEAALFQEQLSAAGYRSYGDFIAGAAQAELAARPEAAAILGPVNELSAMRGRLAQLSVTQDDLLGTFSTLYLVPTNMRILASRLEPSGGPVSAIADSYKRTAAELMSRLRGTAGKGQGAARDLLGRMDEAIYFSAITRILRIAAANLQNDQAFGHGTLGIDLRAVLTWCERMEELNTASVDAVLTQIRHLQHEAEAIQRLMSGLEQVRILGEVESGRLRQNDGGLASIMGQLHDFHARIRSRLNAMIRLSVEMSAMMT